MVYRNYLHSTLQTRNKVSHSELLWADGRATAQVLIFVKIDQKCSKFPLASDFMAISGSVDSTTNLANGLYVPHMVLNTS